jgi:hypothetical protein
VVTFLAALSVQLLVELYRAWRSPDMDASIWGAALAVAVYTAVWAPFLLWALIRLERWTGLGPDRRLAAY